jgi:hypothetical protein
MDSVAAFNSNDGLLVFLRGAQELWRMKTDAELAGVPGWQERMRWVGQFVGYCLWTGEVALIPLLPSVLNVLLDHHIQWRDLMLDSPSLYTNYLQMQEHKQSMIATVYDLYSETSNR